ncbi:MAG TPA: hypothetical protein ENJ23_02040 [Bacteroidetes bacterium]|nr:hypothetical protein [Bacteroidota bacterium]
MVELKKLDVWSVIKIAFLLSLTLGLVIGFFYFSLLSLIGQIAGTLGGEEMQLENFGAGMGLFIAIFIAIFTALFYTLVSAILAVLYNLFASWAGGIRVKLDVEQVEGEASLND